MGQVCPATVSKSSREKKEKKKKGEEGRNSVFGVYAEFGREFGRTRVARGFAAGMRMKCKQEDEKGGFRSLSYVTDF